MIAPLTKKPLPIFLRALLILLAALLLFAVQIVFSQLGVRIADLFSFRRINPSNAFAWISVHHIVQGAAILIVMALISFLFRTDFHLGLGDKRLGMRIVLLFTAIIAVYQFALWFLLDALSLFKPFAYPVNTQNVLGAMSFQLFLSGTSEELLFRAFPITLLSMLTSKTFRLFKTQVSVPLSVVIAAVTFTLAHINWTVNPFRLQYDVLQLLYALAMGIIQGWAYVKTRSVVYPMMMHGISNVIVSVISIVMPILF